jgi:hypothetical protein
MVTKSVFKERKYKVKKNKLTKKKAKKTFKHTGGQNTTNLKTPTNQNQETLPTNGTENQEYLLTNDNGNEELRPNNTTQETLPNNPELENDNKIQRPAVGLYNNSHKQTSETELSKAIRKERGGLFISYPPEINGDKEKAMAEKLNLTNSREPGFTSYRGEIADQIEPKFKIDNFYPKYLSYYKLSENTQNMPSNNVDNMGNNIGNMEGNVEGNMEGNNIGDINMNNNPNTKTQSSA